MIKEAIAKFMDGQSPSRREAYLVMDEILSNKATEAQISAFLVAMQIKGSTVDEVAGSVDAYRERITPLSISDDNAVDTSGTTVSITQHTGRYRLRAQHGNLHAVITVSDCQGLGKSNCRMLGGRVGGISHLAE